MKKFFSPLNIGIITFTTIVTISVLWFNSHSEIESYEKTDFARIPTVEYCDVKENPQSYDGKIIRIKSTLYWFMHGYFLADGNCPEGSDQARTAISFYPGNSSMIRVTLDEFRKPFEPYGPVNLVAVGRFTYKNQLGATDSIHDRTHLQFEIHTVEFVAEQ